METAERFISAEVWHVIEQGALRHATYYYKWLQTVEPKSDDPEWPELIAAIRWAYLNKELPDFLSLAGTMPAIFSHFIGLSFFAESIKALRDERCQKDAKMVAAIHHHISNEFYYNGMGRFLESINLDMLIEAEKESRKAIELDGSNMNYRDHLVIILHQGMRNEKAALTELKIIIDLDPTGFHGEKAREGLADLQKRANVNHDLPAEARIPFAAGLMHHRAGRLRQAIDEYKLAQAAAPNYLPRYEYGIPIKIGQVTWITDYRSYPYMDYNEMVGILRSNINRLSISLDYDINLCTGLAYIQSGDYKNGVSELKKVIGADDSNEMLFNFDCDKKLFTMVSNIFGPITGKQDGK